MDKSAFFDSEILLTMRYMCLYVLLCVKTGINFRGYNKPASMLQQLGVAIHEHLCYSKRQGKRKALQRPLAKVTLQGHPSFKAHWLVSFALQDIISNILIFVNSN